MTLDAQTLAVLALTVFAFALFASEKLSIEATCLLVLVSLTANPAISLTAWWRHASTQCIFLWFRSRIADCNMQLDGAGPRPGGHRCACPGIAVAGAHAGGQPEGGHTGGAHLVCRLKWRAERYPDRCADDAHSRRCGAARGEPRPRARRLQIDKVADLEGAFVQQRHAGNEVADNVLQAETDTDADCARLSPSSAWAAFLPVFSDRWRPCRHFIVA